MAPHPRDRGAQGDPPCVAVIVCTIGRPQALDNLLKSVSPQLAPYDRVVVVAQGEYEAVEDVCTEWKQRGVGLEFLASARGLSLGRNLAVASLGRESEWLLVFPNDTSTFVPGCLGELRALFAESSLGAMAVVDERGPKFATPSPSTPLDRTNVWNVIEPGLVVRRSLYESLGGFDVQLGTGAESPWQSGEGTDLLLRALERGWARDFLWVPPSRTKMLGSHDASGLRGSERRRKLRRYGRGLGYVVRRWRYPATWKVRLLVAGMAFGVRHPGYSVFDGWAVFFGRLEGLAGRTLSSRASDHSAVGR